MGRPALSTSVVNRWLYFASTVSFTRSIIPAFTGGGPLCEGELEGKIVTCPWHGWTYDVTTGDCTQNPTVKVEKTRGSSRRRRGSSGGLRLLYRVRLNLKGKHRTVDHVGKANQGNQFHGLVRGKVVIELSPVILCDLIRLPGDEFCQL